MSGLGRSCGLAQAATANAIETDTTKTFTITLLLDALSDIYVDDHRHMIAQPRAAPGLEGADAEMPYFADPGRRQEDIIDVVGRPILGAVAPIERGFALLAVRLAADGVVGADQAEAFLEDPHLARMVDAPARLVPDGVAVEVARDHGRPLVEKTLVA